MFNVCHSERSRGISRNSLNKSSRAAFLLAILASVAFGQESPSPIPSSTVEESPAPSISPEELFTPTPAPAQTPSASTTRSVRISFVPPPLEGTISVGIYDKSGKLVRVLHQQAQLNEFAIGADGLVTQWNGQNDEEQDLPPGRYHARGYVTGPFKIEALGESSVPSTESKANAKVKVKLVPNPLRKEKRPVVELGIGFDSDGSYLKTSDDLPLFTVSETPNLTRVWINKKNEDSVDVWQDDGNKVHQFRLSNLDQMMAFDCGEFDLK
jgi:hypothetical protein